jgi:hypothetical protein
MAPVATFTVTVTAVLAAAAVIVHAASAGVWMLLGF